ncbi:MAG TPA: class I lanthipeptide [Thermoanaerobaculia bacterium]
MKKTTIKKITLSKETLLSLQENGLRVGGGNTGPSCEIFRLCTIAGWDC